MKIKTLIIIFLIFCQNFIFTIINCEQVSISRRDYNLSAFDEGEEYISPKPVGNKDVFAFNYYFFDNYRDNIKAVIFNKTESINELEKRKFTPDLILFFLDIIFPSNNNETQRNKFEKEMKALNDDKINENLEEYKAIKDEKSNGYNIGGKTVQNTLIYSTTVYSVKKALPLMSKKVSELALSNPYVAAVIIGIPIIYDIGSKFYNWYIDGKIQIKRKEAYKIKGLFFQIMDNLKKLKWINNNMVLAALSRDVESPNYASKFDYYEGIKYKNDEEVKEYMANFTCTFRSNCDYIFCRKNLKKYIICKEKEKKGKVGECPVFMDDCSLIDI